MNFLKKITLFSLALTLSGLPSFAQLTRGTILGQVQDPSGAVVANASVKILNNATGGERSTTSQSDGLYRLAGVDPGIYTVTFSAPGFSDSKIACR